MYSDLYKYTGVPQNPVYFKQGEKMNINLSPYINLNICSTCRVRKNCFLINGNKLSYCLNSSQKVIIDLMPKAFEYKWNENIWRSNLDNFDGVFSKYLVSYGGWVPANAQHHLTLEEQRKSDLEYIREMLKQLLTAASDATKNTDPMSSIMFDGIGLVLASDYMDAVNRVVSMISTAAKVQSGGNCKPFVY